MTRKAILTILLPAVLHLALLTSPAEAQNVNQAKAEKLFAEGADSFRAGRYGQALAKFKEAYELFQEPNLVFNIARSYQALGKNRLAIEHYKKFLNQPNIDPSTKTKAEAKLESLEAIMQESKSKEGGTGQTGTTSTEDSAEQSGEKASGSQQKARRSVSLLTWITLGTGVATVVVGSVLMAMGASDHSKVEDVKENAKGIKMMTQKEMQDLIDSGDTKKVVGVVLLGAGCAALATSVVLFYLDLTSSKKEKPETSVTVAPIRGGGTVLFQGSF